VSLLLTGEAEMTYPEVVVHQGCCLANQREGVVPMEYPSVKILQGDALTLLRTLPDESVHMTCTSPPY